MNWVLKIAPKKLKEIDIRLRENYPSIWATRIHLTAYLGLLYTAVAALLALATPMDFHNVLSQRDIKSTFGIFMIPTIIFIGYVIIQLVLYNIEKRNGITSKKIVWVTFPLTFIALIIPFIAPYTNSALLNFKTANLLSDKDVYENSVALTKARYYANEGVGTYYHNPQKILQYEYQNVLEPTEQMYTTIDPLRDSIYNGGGIFKKQRPRLRKHYRATARYDYRYSFQTHEKLDTLSRVFYDNQNAYLSLDSAQIYLSKSKELVELFSPYRTIKVDSVIYELKNNIYFNTYSAREYRDEHRYSYTEYIVEESIELAYDENNKIIAAKRNWIPRDLSNDVFWVIITIMFTITNLIFIFKWVSWQQFLLNFFIGGLYLTIIGVITSMMRHKGMVFPTLFLLLLVTSLTFMNLVWRRTKFSFLINQFAMIGFYSMPYLPIFVFNYLKSDWDVFVHPYWDKYKTTLYNANGEPYIGYSQEYYDIISTIRMSALWGGIVIFLIFGLPYFYKIFKRLNALPKAK